MKIFISHSSKNKDYGSAVVDLLKSVGVKPDQILFTSNPAYGIPIRQNIFEWLKSRIQEKSYVVYLLSEEYYSSVACLNEMGAAWVIENKGTMLFVPGFNLSSHEFQNGALDPREIGFYLFDEDRVTEFIESLRQDFEISRNPVLINQSIKAFLKSVQEITFALSKGGSELTRIEEGHGDQVLPKSQMVEDDSHTSLKRFLGDLNGNKFKDVDVVLLWYSMDTGSSKLKTGWQEDIEVEKIKAWEEVNELPLVLSQQYTQALNRLEMRKLLKVSQVTSANNPKEMEYVGPITTLFVEQPKEFADIIEKVVQRLKMEKTKTKEDECPFK